MGGLPLKIAAAAKAGRKTVLIPCANADVLNELSDELKAIIEVKLVATAKEAIALALV